MSKPVAPGTYDVRIEPVVPAGAPIVVLPSVFTVMALAMDVITPDNGYPGDSITITGDYFGTKKDKVQLTYTDENGTILKSCTITDWTMDTTSGASTIIFLVPAGLLSHPYDLVVTNSVGSDTKAGGFLVH